MTKWPYRKLWGGEGWTIEEISLQASPKNIQWRRRRDRSSAVFQSRDRSGDRKSSVANGWEGGAETGERPELLLQWWVGSWRIRQTGYDQLGHYASCRRLLPYQSKPPSSNAHSSLLSRLYGATGKYGGGHGYSRHIGKGAGQGSSRRSPVSRKGNWVFLGA